jgi:hypothetical protein
VVMEKGEAVHRFGVQMAEGRVITQHDC